MKRTLAPACLLLLACAEPQKPALPEFGDEKPNVLVVLVDVLRRDHLGVYGYPLPTSPNIDAFATGAFRFDRAYSHSTWTKPSVATLFTSVYPDQHGLGRVGFESAAGFQTDVLPLNLETLAERFREAGYRTASFGGNVHIQRKTGFGQGFKKFFLKRQVTAFHLNRLFLEWLTGTGSKPFFGYLHYMDAHWPYNRKLPDETGRFGSTGFPRRAPPENWTAVPRWAERFLDAESLATITARFDQEIAYVDAAFGELITALEERGLLDETVIVFIADHGEGLNEHGELQHGFEPYAEVTGVPLLIRLPPVYRLTPLVAEAPVGLVDVMPTVLDLVGLESPAYAQGRSLVPYLTGEGLRERPIYQDGPGIRALRSSRHTVFVAENGEQLCFDRSVDPMELTPVSGADAKPCDRLAAALEEMVGGFESLAESTDGNATVTLDAEEIEALRALGYLD